MKVRWKSKLPVKQSNPNQKGRSENMAQINRALISVSEKAGILNFAKALAHRGIEIISTSGTAKLLADNNVPIMQVSDFTGFPELFEGRVKTLHPKIEGGLLYRRENKQDLKEAFEHGILPIDLVVCNLYPFKATVAKAGCTLGDAIENIDIGGPTMLRAAAKNCLDVTVIVDFNDYARVLAEMNSTGGDISRKTNFYLARKIFEHTCSYDAAIARYLFDKVVD